MARRTQRVRSHQRSGVRVSSFNRTIDINKDKRPDLVLKTKRDSRGKTTFIQDPRTGIMKGRSSTRGRGDNTAVLRVVNVRKGSGYGRLTSKQRQKASKRYKIGVIVGRTK